MRVDIKRYSELILIPTFEERFEYLKLGGVVGAQTFGYDRVFNQKFYSSIEWKRLRDRVIFRDNGCDLGIQDRQIMGKIYIHHINPIMIEDIQDASEFLLNPEYLICVSHDTHNAIHYGDRNLLISSTPVERTPYDTCPWRRVN